MRTAFDLSHVKSVSAVALTFKGKFAGKIVANWGDGRGGYTCTLTVSVWKGPLCKDGNSNSATTRAGGSGYDKFASALCEAMSQFGKSYEECSQIDAGRAKESFESWGYKYLEVL